MGSMKANKKFVEEKEAVSAVIGVILMVAITVAIAATVYYYVTVIMTGPGTTTPNISWSKGTDYLEVVSADNNLDWADVTVGGTNTGNTDTGPNANEIDAGERIEGCSGTVTVTWTPTNTLLGTWDF